MARHSIVAVRFWECLSPASHFIKPGDTKVVVGLADFLDSKKQTMPDWSNVSTLTLEFIQKGKSIPLKGNTMLQSLEWTAGKAEK